MKLDFETLVRKHTAISERDVGAACMAHAAIIEDFAGELERMRYDLHKAIRQVSVLQGNEDRLLAWLDDYLHDHAMATNPDNDLPGAVLDVFRQQRCTIELLTEALEAHKNKAYAALPKPEKLLAKTGRRPGVATDFDTQRAAVIAHMQEMARNGWGPTQREWDADEARVQKGLPTQRAMVARHGTWASMIAAAGLRMVRAGMASDDRPAEVDECEPEPEQPQVREETIAMAPLRPTTNGTPRNMITQQRTIRDSDGRGVAIQTRRYVVAG